MPRERRAYVRFDLSVKVLYRIIKPPHSRRVRSKNIGGKGIGLIVEEEIPVGSELALEIYLPSIKTPVFAEGNVVWLRATQIEFAERTFDAGIKFTKIAKSNLETIVSFCYDRMLRVSH